MEPSSDKAPVQSPASESVGTPIAPSAPDEPFPALYNIFAIAPFITGLIGTIVSFNTTDDSGLLGWLAGILFIVATGLMLFGFVKQILYIRRSLPERNIKPQLVLAVASLAVPALGAVFGDISGLINFGGSANTDSGLWFCLAVAAGFASWVVSFIAIGNIIIINTRQQATALRVIAIILQVLGWAALLALAFVLYVFAYAARDPQSE